MASRRTVTTRDRQRNSTSRKRTVREHLTRQQQQAKVMASLWKQAKEELKASA